MPAADLLTRGAETTWTNFHGTVTVPIKVLWHRRWRAEARLRELPLAG